MWKPSQSNGAGKGGLGASPVHQTSVRSRGTGAARRAGDRYEAGRREWDGGGGCEGGTGGIVYLLGFFPGVGSIAAGITKTSAGERRLI